MIGAKDWIPGLKYDRRVLFYFIWRIIRKKLLLIEGIDITVTGFTSEVS